MATGRKDRERAQCGHPLTAVVLQKVFVNSRDPEL